MSRFSKEKRENIELLLLKEAELLFSKNDLKKVTVDDIVQKVNIGKGTFYHFYENKEHIYLELYMRAQAEVFHDVEIIISSARQYEAKELCYEVMLKILEGFSKHPILYSTDEKVWSQVTKKVRKDYNVVNNAADKYFFEKVVSAGVQFKYPDDVVIKLMQSSCLMAMVLMKSDKEMIACKIMLKALLDYIVEGDNTNE
jgi:AcrR family transcriptional regulator